VLGIVAALLGSCDDAADEPKPAKPAAGPEAAAAAAETKPAEVVPGVGDYASRPTPDKPPTALHRALAKGSLDTAKALIADPATDVNAQMSDGLAPLHIAVGEGYGEIVGLLLERGADPSVEQAAGATPLLIALDLERVELVDLLLEKGADPNAQDAKGFGALHRVCSSKLDTAARIALAEKLLAKGVQVDQRTKEGATPLHVASERVDLELVTFLLDHGAGIDVQGPKGYSALHFAAAKKSKPLCELLVARGANVNLKHEGRATPAQIAAGDENMELFEFFRAHGAKFD
jgi:ankyrin repeat protein